MHRVLARLGRAGFEPARLDDVFEDVWRTSLAQGMEDDVSGEFERELLLEQLRALLDVERALLAGSASSPRHFELAFGLRDEGEDEERDPASQREGVRLALPAAAPLPATTLRGSIDRVDVVERGGVLFGIAIDYKSGKGKSYYDEAMELADFQLPIYCEALPRFGITPVGGMYLGIASGERHGVVRTDFAEAFGLHGCSTVDKFTPEEFMGYMDERRAALLEHVVRMAEGEIEIRPRKNDCKYCDLRPVCRIGTFGVGGAGEHD